MFAAIAEDTTPPTGGFDTQVRLGEIAEQGAALCSQISQFQARLVELAAECESLGGFLIDISARDWVTWRWGITPAEGGRLCWLGRRLHRLPKLADAFASGQLSEGVVTAMVSVATPENEATLLETAEAATGAQLLTLIRSFRKIHPNPKVRNEHHSARVDDDGWVTGSYRLNVENGSTLFAALRAARELETEEGGNPYQDDLHPDEIIEAKEVDAFMRLSESFLNQALTKDGLLPERFQTTIILEHADDLIADQPDEPSDQPTAYANPDHEPPPAGAPEGGDRDTDRDLGATDECVEPDDVTHDDDQHGHGDTFDADRGVEVTDPSAADDHATDADADADADGAPRAEELPDGEPDSTSDDATDEPTVGSGEGSESAVTGERVRRSGRTPGWDDPDRYFGYPLFRNEKLGFYHREQPVLPPKPITTGYLGPRRTGHGLRVDIEPDSPLAEQWWTDPDPPNGGRGQPNAYVRGFGSIPLPEISPFLCESVISVIIKKHGVAVTVSSPTRLATKEQLRVLFDRDRCCQFPGCGRQYGLIAHHVWFHDLHGPTHVYNMALLCKRCHRRVHTKGWRMTIEDRGHTKRFWTPDGTEITATSLRPARRDTDIPEPPPPGERLTGFNEPLTHYAKDVLITTWLDATPWPDPEDEQDDGEGGGCGDPDRRSQLVAGPQSRRFLLATTQ